MNGLVSIMMPVYNGEHSVDFALSSVLAQTYPDWECIVVDDGSTDATAAVLESMDDSRIRVISFPENKGRGVARQAALEAARGEYLAFLDADDWMYPGKLRRQLEVLEAYPGAAAVSGKSAIVENRVHLLGMDWGMDEPSDGPVVRRFDALCRPRLNFPLALLRMDVAKRYRYDPARRRAEDLDFMLRALRGSDFVLDNVANFAYAGWRLNRRRSLSTARAEREIYGSYFRSEPASALRLWMESMLKSAVVSLPSGAVGDLWAARHHLRTPSPVEVSDFDLALEQIQAVYQEREWTLSNQPLKDSDRYEAVTQHVD